MSENNLGRSSQCHRWPRLVLELPQYLNIATLFEHVNIESLYIEQIILTLELEQIREIPSLSPSFIV